LDVANANIFDRLWPNANKSNDQVQLADKKAQGGMSSQLEVLEMSSEGGQKRTRP